MLEFISEHWFLNTILVTLGIGLVSFISKVFAERNYNIRFVNIFLYGFLTFYSLLFAWYMGFVSLPQNLFLLTILYGFQIYAYSLILIAALRYLPTSTYLISVRLLSSFSLLAIGVFFFGDVIATKDVLGFVTGVVAMILLFEKEEKEGLNYKKGALLLAIGTAALVFGHTTHKVFSSSLEIQPTVIAVAFSSAFILSLILGANTLQANSSILRPVLKLNILQSLVMFYYFVMLFEVYNLGSLGISYKIQSYSPFVAIILASFIYHEKISVKKKFALILVAISLWFFY